jgi:nucleoside-diphosphate-sugar epimerase
VLVTGGTGFIGRHLVAALIEKGARVKVLARERTTPEGYHRRQSDQIDRVIGDLYNPGSLVRVCEGMDTVFHLAGYAHAEDHALRLEDSPHWQISVVGTQALLDDAIAAGVKRMVFASTVKAMGEGGAGCLDEGSATHPEDHYGKAKLEGERLVLSAGRRGDLHTAVLRLAMVYGRDNAGNLPRMMSAIDRGRFPPLPDTHNRRSMVRVEDVIQGLLLAAENPIANGQIYIITDDEIYSSRRIYEAMCQALGRPPPRWRVPATLLWAGGRLGDLLRTLRLPAPITTAAMRKLLGSAWYSCDKAKRELGYRPHYRLEDALPEMVAYARAQHPKLREVWDKE